MSDGSEKLRPYLLTSLLQSFEIRNVSEDRHELATLGHHLTLHLEVALGIVQLENTWFRALKQIEPCIYFFLSLDFLHIHHVV
jgi:hypothetical protein